MNSPEQNVLNEPATRRARLHVAYNGQPFHGFATNDDVETVQGKLTQAFTTAARFPVEISAAGRTDAGVHARAQVISLDLPADIDLHNLVRSVNAMCKPHIAVSHAQWAEPQFDARFSATWRRYKYTIQNTPEPQPLMVDRAWHIWEPLNIALMNLACDPLIGEQDFSAFCRKPDVFEHQEPASLKRYVYEAKWYEGEEGTVIFEIRANAFCHQMVRSLVGFLVDVGTRKRPPSDTRFVMLKGDRNHGSQVAPPHGLVLWDVGYDGVRIHP